MSKSSRKMVLRTLEKFIGKIDDMRLLAMTAVIKDDETSEDLSRLIKEMDVSANTIGQFAQAAIDLLKPIVAMDAEPTPKKKE